MPFDDIRNSRIEKLNRLRATGVDPYPATTARTHSIADALVQFESLSSDAHEIVLAGRIMAHRTHGGISFIDLDDGSGAIQGLVGNDRLSEEPYQFFLSVVDVGDIIEITGALTTTKRGERSIDAKKWRMLTKSIRPLPEKWHGLQDVEERYRQRHVDILMNRSVHDALQTRFKLIAVIRKFFQSHDFLEVETPTLQVIPGGASARPFETHMNDLDLNLFLRVAPELYLKRLLVGGFERIFEIGKCFRNEGMDRDHNPEFTMLEAYAAWKDREWLMSFTEDLIVSITTEIFGSPEVVVNGRTIIFKKPFARMTFAEAAERASGIPYNSGTEEEYLVRAHALGIVVEKATTKAVLADEIYKKALREEIIDPIFIIDHPLELSPLSKRISPNSDTVARFQLIVGGFELCNAFSELNDPIDQRGRFEAQENLRAKGNQEAQRIDEDFLSALECGMPPAAGIGIGIDRLVAFLTSAKTLREILPFPTMKPTKTDA